MFGRDTIGDARRSRSAVSSDPALPERIKWISFRDHDSGPSNAPLGPECREFRIVLQSPDNGRLFGQGLGNRLGGWIGEGLETGQNEASQGAQKQPIPRAQMRVFGFVHCVTLISG